MQVAKNKFLDKIIIIGGPTASGKSELALKVAQELVDGVIINADAIQLYKDIDILTACPSSRERQIVPHYLYNIIDYKDRYSVADWLDASVKQIIKTLEVKKTPIIVGGTGMYIYNLLNGLREVKDIPKEMELRTAELVEDKGLGYLYDKLKSSDVHVVNYFSENDRTRIIRAYNLLKAFNITPSEYRGLPNKKFFSNNKFINLALLPEREFLYKNCNERFIRMVENGAITEVEALKSRGVTRSDPISKAIGFKNLYSYLCNEIPIEEAITLGQQETRNFAKRQTTWFRNQLNENIANIVDQDIMSLFNKLKDKLC